LFFMLIDVNPIPIPPGYSVLLIFFVGVVLGGLRAEHEDEERARAEGAEEERRTREIRASSLGLKQSDLDRFDQRRRIAKLLGDPKRRGSSDA
jgi:hypothetical protein